jgi:predicted TIM-barrel fold metal-dependent hydrolase
MTHVVSFVTHGAFERYRDLKLLVIESGVSWLPGLLWNLDGNYDRLRLESPWVKRRPSDYLRERVKLTTQPLEIPRDGRSNLVELLQSVEGIEDMLCFASDYPHWDSDALRFITRHLPTAWHEKIFAANARMHLGLPANRPGRAAEPHALHP